MSEPPPVPWQIHRLPYRGTDHRSIHVRVNKEQGTTRGEDLPEIREWRWPEGRRES